MVELTDASYSRETQLWSDNDRLGGLRDAVTATLRDTEHAQARLQRLKDAMAADEAAQNHAQIHPARRSVPALPFPPLPFSKNKIKNAAQRGTDEPYGFPFNRP